MPFIRNTHAPIWNGHGVTNLSKIAPGVLETLLTLHKNELRSQVAGLPSVHHKVVKFKRERASVNYALHSGPPVTNALVLAIIVISEWSVHDRDSIMIRKLIGT